VVVSGFCIWMVFKAEGMDCCFILWSKRYMPADNAFGGWLLRDGHLKHDSSTCHLQALTAVEGRLMGRPESTDAMRVFVVFFVYSPWRPTDRMLRRYAARKRQGGGGGAGDHVVR
jgi:hypothetical protein